MLFPSKVKRSCCNEDACCNNGGVTAKAFKDLNDRVTALEEGGAGVSYEEVPVTFSGGTEHNRTSMKVEVDDAKEGLYLVLVPRTDGTTRIENYNVYIGEYKGSMPYLTNPCIRNVSGTTWRTAYLKTYHNTDGSITFLPFYNENYGSEQTSTFDETYVKVYRLVGAS